MAEYGSITSETTWKKVDMPSGVPICEQVVSAESINASDNFLWPTPATLDYGSGISPRVQITGYLASVVKRLATIPYCQRLNIPLSEIKDYIRLHPEYSRWLMGYPPTWNECVPDYEIYTRINTIIYECGGDFENCVTSILAIIERELRDTEMPLFRS
jgi:hypothetical protein